MKIGNVIEYIDHQKIMCGVILEVKKQKLRVLTENDREIKLSPSRLSHKCNTNLNLSMGRYKLVEALKVIAGKRNALIDHIDIKELWGILNTEKKWINLATMTEFCFPDGPTYDHESAVVRAFFKNRSYFKFNHDRFFPFSEEQVEQIACQQKEAARKNRIIDEGSAWLKKMLIVDKPYLPDDKRECVEILKSCYLFQKESPNYSLGKAILKKADIDNMELIFQILVKLGIWDENENIELYRLEIPTVFPDEVMEKATNLISVPKDLSEYKDRQDLTGLSAITIDGQSTLDFDDAISIEDKSDHYRLGIHIADVGHFIKKETIIDKEAFTRGSSIYMPDQKISMFPSSFAENLCSLREGELRPSISIIIKLSRSAEIINYEIVPSLVKVKRQLTYYDVNTIANEDHEILILYDIAKKFREKRLKQGATQISLPDINVWLDNGEVNVTKINRESPGRMLISEIMIMANWLMAEFLLKHDMPAIFRSQAEPRERLYKGEEGTLFQNCMQRKLLSRFILSYEPENHSGLGLNAYVTATSPIRKYFDLVTQRQIRGIIGLEEPYTKEEIDSIIQRLEQPMSYVSKIQYSRHRYWLLKFLERKIGEKQEAIVLSKRKEDCQVLLAEYMIECDLPISTGINLKPRDLIHVTIQHVNARKDVISVFAS
ncbi:MAG: RNB domain-containing ribonuclease [Proteobacteria bacterium]|nr:RNB domain-containing ribonuclease [Pseudomonadota bacterium]